MTKRLPDPGVMAGLPLDPDLEVAEDAWQAAGVDPFAAAPPGR